MDIAKPVGDEIGSVKFGFLSTEDVERISVKQIVNPVVFDHLGHPTSGGLYDLALGPFRRNPCATCRLDSKFCPGHFGHISLPCPVYHPLFFSQMFVLLRSVCLYCHHFKLAKIQVHLFCCKFRLLAYGLLNECKELDEMIHKQKDPASDSDRSEHLEEGAEAAAHMEQRDRFVRKKIRRAMANGLCNRMNTAAANERRKLIREFMKRLSRRKCDNCHGKSPSFRKDGFSKIFEMPLSKKDQVLMQQKAMIRDNVLDRRKISHVADKAGTANDEGYDGEDSEESSDTDRHAGNVERSSPGTYLTVAEIRTHLRKLFENEREMVMHLYSLDKLKRTNVSADIFFLHAIAVPPNRFRPASLVGDEVHENVQNEALSKVLNICSQIVQVMAQVNSKDDDEISALQQKSAFSRLIQNFVALQIEVNSFIDSTKSPTPTFHKLPVPGIKQFLEKKEGIFRKNMMGKRVNFAARSVISPDPNIETNEIGVPPVFAEKLTYPEPVTAHNFQELRQAVINGPRLWPGAVQIQNENGINISLKTMTKEERIAQANQLLTPQHQSNTTEVHYVNKKVLRHLRNHDVVLFNRQPTLHKPSMMGHKVRVLPGEKTIRLHYANTNAYNADFDGDEMNLHFPQNENARAEAMTICNTDSQYLVSTSGNPLRGLIQDHIVTGVWMTNKETMFTREEYQQLIYGSLRPEDGHTSRNRLLTLAPAIWKPQALWTGKQLISTVLLNLTPLGKDVQGLNLDSKAKVASSYWGDSSLEGEVIFRDGELLCGVLDKSQFGASAFGMVHSVHELYGPSAAGKLLSVLGRLFTKFIQSRGFTCRMDDLRLSASGDIWRRDLIDGNKDAGQQASCAYVMLDNISSDPQILRQRLEEVLRDDEKLAGLDAAVQSKMNGVTSSIIKQCIPDGLLKPFPHNSMQAMTLSGAKGSNVNVSQISCLLGQQELEGRRVPTMISGKSLPSFVAFDSSAKAGGYISGRFLTGVKPQEYYFHCMAGREGLIDTAVKTSRSGYLQRCLTKHMEGLQVNYDHTVRDSDGSLIQFLYGEDSLDVTKQKHLDQFKFCTQNFQSLIQKYQPARVASVVDTVTAQTYIKKIMKKRKKYIDASDFKRMDNYDPALSIYDPSKFLGSVSESFYANLDAYIDRDPDRTLARKGEHESPLADRKSVRQLMYLKYMRSMVEPGEAVGMLAGQSIGEPSTQMTLNTFHFAGFGAKNVTLGIPRLREIVMTASAAIKTPTMSLTVRPHISDQEVDVFCKNLSRRILSEFIENVKVTERVALKPDEAEAKTYIVHLSFFPSEEYEEEYGVSKTEIIEVLEKTFIRRLDAAISKELKRRIRNKGESQIGFDEATPQVGTAAAKVSVDESSNEQAQPEHEFVDESASDNGDDDATNTRLKSRQEDIATYDEPDEDEKEDGAIAGEEQNKKSVPEAFVDEGIGSPLTNDLNDDHIQNQATLRNQRLIEKFTNVKKFSFDDQKGRWCEVEMEYPAAIQKILMVNIVEKVCKETVVHQLSGILRCYEVPTENPADSLVCWKKIKTNFSVISLLKE